MIYLFNGQPGCKGNLVKRQIDFQQIPGNLDFTLDPSFFSTNFPAVIFRSRKKFQTDMQSNWATAEDNGRKIGREEGRAEGKIEVARNLLKMNLSLDQIAIATGLTIEEVNHLRIDEGE